MLLVVKDELLLKRASRLRWLRIPTALER